MRSSSLFRRSRSWLKQPSTNTAVRAGSTSRPPRTRRPDHPAAPKRLSSTSFPAMASEESNSSPDTPGDGPFTPPADEPPEGDAEKPRIRRTRVSPSIPPPKDSEPLQLPEELDIFWIPEESSQDPSSSKQASLPPPQILDEALNHLQITLHPQTQHRATFPSPLGPPVEPTLALYCPIEGGEYIIDATVRELARRTGAEVLVLDSVHLAAGEWGHFGKAANSLQLPRNPLHFTASPVPQNSGSRPYAIENEDDSDGPSSNAHHSPQMTLTVMTPSNLQGRSMVTPSPRRNPPPSRIKVFFDALVNTPSKFEISTTSTSKTRPRLIYIRDFPMLAPTSSAWYPPLLSAVRQRRRGPMPRPSSPVLNPMTIIFGMTPSLTPPSLHSASGPSGLMSLLMNRQSAPTQSPATPRSEKADWSEDESADKARERRLRERLRKWDKDDASLRAELPRLSVDTEESGQGEQKPEIVVIGGHGMPMPLIPSLLGGGMSPSSRGNDVEGSTNFFRTSILVPSIRSPSDERTTRVARRREINELTMRMGVGRIGGVLEAQRAADFHASQVADSTSENAEEAVTSSPPTVMWEEWGNKVELWSKVRQIADRAVGQIMSAPQSEVEQSSLSPTEVTWPSIHQAWVAHRSSNEMRKVWLKDTSGLGKVLRLHNEEEGEPEEEEQQSVDELVEQIKNDPDLDPHEQRLLSCIVDSASMPTSFSQVHLPPHTIDSVRTIVSLPLLHPHAFQQGILKEHGMTGCLLFGPPGTGKTLVVRALAKEAGCRMMAISPSDVMDMYVGEGEKLVRAVFSLARKLSPCVVFLDEIDALFGARMSARESGGAIAHRGVITEFMQEMDGLKSSKEDNVIVIGATNRPFDLDDAVLRRLPRRLLVDLPGEKEREEILKILLRDESMAADVDVKELAKRTESFSGSDLKHLCVAAALDAVKENVQLPWSTTTPAITAIEATATVAEPVTVAETAVETNATAKNESASNILVEKVDQLELSTTAVPPLPVRTLHLRNFNKALKEITPSSSEALGSLADLRKWNEEFGEGRRDRKKLQVWGKGHFGFIDKAKPQADGRVAVASKNSSPVIDLGVD